MDEPKKSHYLFLIFQEERHAKEGKSPGVMQSSKPVFKEKREGKKEKG